MAKPFTSRHVRFSLQVDRSIPPGKCEFESCQTLERILPKASAIFAKRVERKDIKNL